MLSALAQLRVIGAVAADSAGTGSTATTSNYKALVCLFMGGGNDSNSVIVPYDTADYQYYSQVRAELAVPQSNLLPIFPGSYSDGRSYALNGAMPEVQGLFGQGLLALLANVGSLAQPTTLGDFAAGNGLPLQLFSHADQVGQWQSSIADKPFVTGWGGRLADIVNAMNNNNKISMSITLSGTNLFQLGNTVSQFAVNSSGVPGLNYGPVAAAGYRASGILNLVNGAQANLLAAAYGNVASTAITDGNLLSNLLNTATALNTVFPPTPTASQLAMVAKLISLAPVLGLNRQIFFVQLPGFDLHAGQVAGHGPLLAEVSAALGAFYSATVELGVANQVTTFTASDFGRTYVPNSGGTDHGWGSHHMIMGGAVKGGDIYGAMPSLAIGGPDDTGQGRWLPSTSVDEYSATLATWFGVSATNLATVLPNIGRFSSPDLGFMG
jgi:uncharacterized protein (DUF1501 family)